MYRCYRRNASNMKIAPNVFVYNTNSESTMCILKMLFISFSFFFFFFERVSSTRQP